MNDIFSGFRKVDEDLLDELEEILIMSDIGVETSSRIIENLRDRIRWPCVLFCSPFEKRKIASPSHEKAIVDGCRSWDGEENELEFLRRELASFQ